MQKKLKLVLKVRILLGMKQLLDCTDGSDMFPGTLCLVMTGKPKPKP